jgi:hypothetical protein
MSPSPAPFAAQWRPPSPTPRAAPRTSPVPAPSPTPRWDAPAASFTYRASAYEIRRMPPASRWYSNRPLANLTTTVGRDAEGVTIKTIGGPSTNPVNCRPGLQLVDASAGRRIGVPARAHAPPACARRRPVARCTTHTGSTWTGTATDGGCGRPGTRRWPRARCSRSWWRCTRSRVKASTSAGPIRPSAPSHVRTRRGPG